MHKYKSSSHIYTSRCTNINQVPTYTYQDARTYFTVLIQYMCGLDLYIFQKQNYKFQYTVRKLHKSFRLLLQPCSQWVRHSVLKLIILFLKISFLCNKLFLTNTIDLYMFILICICTNFKYLCILMCTCANLIYICASWCLYLRTWFVSVHLDVNLQILMFCSIWKSILIFKKKKYNNNNNNSNNNNDDDNYNNLVQTCTCTTFKEKQIISMILCSIQNFKFFAFH